jgi:hypothetical protein
MMDQNECMKYCWARDMTYSDLIVVCATNQVAVPSLYSYAQFCLTWDEQMALDFEKAKEVKHKEQRNAFFEKLRARLRAGKENVRRAWGKAKARRSQSRSHGDDERGDGEEG